MLTPSILLFYMGIMMSIFMMISTSSLMTAWLALELNTLSFIPIILNDKNSKTGEGSIKYFLTQTLASMMILVSVTMMNDLHETILICALSIKLACAPFHSWLPSMSKKISWNTLFILLTIQKINPLILLCETSETMLLMCLSVVSMIWGSLGGVTQTQTNKMMIYSSINQIGWIFIASSLSSNLCFLFFMIYSTTLYPILSTMSSIKMKKLSQIMQGAPMKIKLILFLNLLSLGGLPPFLGFLPKWLILSNLQSTLILTIMILMSLVTLLFYLRIAISSLILSESSFNLKPQTMKIKSNTILLTQTSLLMFFISFLI